MISCMISYVKNYDIAYDIIYDGIFILSCANDIIPKTIILRMMHCTARRARALIIEKLLHMAINIL